MEKSEKKEDLRGRSWVMTLFENEINDQVKRREQCLKPPDWVKFIRFGEEHTKEGKWHLQCWVQCWKQVRWSQFKSWIGDSYRTIMLGSIEQNQEYTSKEGVYTDVGTAPMQGRRTDIIGLKRKLDDIKEGESVYDIAKEEPMFEMVAKYSRFSKEYVNHHRLQKLKSDFTAPEVVYIWGPPGVGKDKYVDEHYPGSYDVPADDGYKWRNGYNLDPIVVYRNISPSAIKNPNQFLKELDRRVCQVATKGDFVPWKPKIIILTSIYSPEMMASAFHKKEEFLRRVTAVKHLE